MTTSDAKLRERPETEIQREILKYLRVVPGMFWRNNSGVVRAPGAEGRHRLVRYGGIKGSADILGCLAPTGRLVAIEVKRPRAAPPTRGQRAFLDGILAANGVAIVATSVLEVAVALDAARGVSDRRSDLA